MRRIIPSVISLYIFLFLMTLSYQYAQAQYLITGIVKDANREDPIVGAQIIVKDKLIGTVTDILGEFSLSTELAPPLLLEVQSIGFKTQELFIREDQLELIILLQPESAIGDKVVVSASRVEEKILEAPVAVEKLGILDLQMSPASDFYHAVSHLKGVMVSPSSLTYQSVNTRGFGNVQNWRFVQLIDGMDINGPGVNYGVGSVMKGSELDIRSIEVVPGPGSALYGPNAFNGLLSMSTKDPFIYQGVSAYLKQGITNQQDVRTNPFFDAGIRYAKSWNSKFAIKLNATYFKGVDWEANDRSYLITNQDIPFIDQLLQTPIGSPTYNAVNSYGDEIQIPVDLQGDSSFTSINRTGIAERDIVDYNIENVFLQASLHYRITPQIEATYDFRFARADNIIRYENFYPFTRFENYFNKLEIKGDNFFIRSYLANDNSGEGYSMLAAGAIIQEGLKSSSQWGIEYGAAYRGEVAGVQGQNHEAARLFADRDIPQPGSQLFNAIRESSIRVPIDVPGGSGVDMRASFIHSEVGYDFKNDFQVFDLQIGGAYRSYTLNSQGHVYNDGPKGFNKKIPVWEYGLYAQAAKKLFRDFFNLRASLRYDRNTNFKGRFTPRVSAVLTLGERRQHNFRASWQTGFRNPANQDTYVAFNAGQLIYLGNIEHNIVNYSDTLADRTAISGKEIYDQLVTPQSFQQFVEAGANDPSLLEPANLEFLKQEQITTFEVGYRGLITPQFLFDLNYYQNTYENFTANILSFSPALQKPILTLNNITEKVRSEGLGIGMEYLFLAGYKFTANYTYTSFDAKKAIATNPNYFPDFNTPQNIVKISLANKEIGENLGFSLKYRWLDNFTFQSPNGQGRIPSVSMIDAALVYKVPSISSLLKLGATNLFNQSYTPVYGGPTLGRQAYIQVVFDPFLGN